MPQEEMAYSWRVISRSEQGASHIRSNLPNQDAAADSKSDDGKPPIILAVADGHGSPKSFRSDIGAKYAVEVAIQVCKEFLENAGSMSPSVIKNEAELKLPRKIIEAWRQKVKQHCKENAFTEIEKKALPEREDGNGEGELWAYGSTLLITIISDAFLLFFQLGDGEILVVSEANEVSRAIPKDESLIANETTSLCMPDPIPAFRFRFQYLSEVPPKIILLSTDGYPNSFQTQDDFFKVATDLLEILHSEGCDSVEKDLSSWLQDASAKGSGDDVTLSIAYRSEFASSSTVRDKAEKGLFTFFVSPFTYFFKQKS